MTFWREVRWQARRVWRNPWWYYALMLFSVGPMINFGWPWWSAVYIPASAAGVLLLAVGYRRTS